VYKFPKSAYRADDVEATREEARRRNDPKIKVSSADITPKLLVVVPLKFQSYRNFLKIIDLFRENLIQRYGVGNYNRRKIW